MYIEKFESNLVAFDFENETVNATDMIKAFPEKKMNNFLRNQQTKDFIDVLKSNTRISVILAKTGNTGGTWMHKLLAYKFASWLSPQFELFVYQTFDKAINERLKQQQRQLDYFWDKQDQTDLYTKSITK